MTRLLFLVCLLAGVVSLQAAAPSDLHKLVECGSERIVLFRDMDSPDGRYAIGWPIRPRNKNARPVEWSSWNMRDEDLFAFLDRYKIFDSDLPDNPYEPVNLIVDLKRKSFLELPADRPHWPRKNRSDLDVLWSPLFGTSRHALIQCDGRFFTRNLWLVNIENDTLHQRDLVKTLPVVVREAIQKKHPSTADSYGAFFPLYGSHFDIPDNAVFKPLSVDIPFLADTPKSVDAESSVIGGVTVSLADGEATLKPSAR